MSLPDEAAVQTDSVLIAFRAPRPLADAAEAAAALEGLTRSDIARRALIYALRDRGVPAAISESARGHSR
jgi:hypothetical protein